MTFTGLEQTSGFHEPLFHMAPGPSLKTRLLKGSGDDPVLLSNSDMLDVLACSGL